jgi:nuclear pore complex protein Nup160
MPGWLVHMEMERDAEAWIGRAIRWGWVGEAIGWTRQLMRDVSLSPSRIAAWHQ